MIDILTYISSTWSFVGVVFSWIAMKMYYKRVPFKDVVITLFYGTILGWIYFVIILIMIYKEVRKDKESEDRNKKYYSGC